jgi:hypothetical protein
MKMETILITFNENPLTNQQILKSIHRTIRIKDNSKFSILKSESKSGFNHEKFHTIQGVK